MFKPVLIGGQDVSSLRAHFDHDNQNIIAASNRQLKYYNIQSGQQSATSNIPESKLRPFEVIVACEKVEQYLYLTTNFGKIFIWCLESRDWLNELSIPTDVENEAVLSCKLIGKRQYLFTVQDNKTNQINLYHSMSRSERERPKQRELIEECSNGDETSFDIGCAVAQNDLTNETNKSTREKLSKQRVLAFIKANKIYFQKLGLGEKLHVNLTTQIIANYDFTCVRANPKRPMVAAGDGLGRIYVYTGDFDTAQQPFSNRTKLHWHSKAVSDLCFSSTGQTLYSVGSESGCVVIWDLSSNHLGRKRVIAGLGMPMRHLNSNDSLQQLILSSEDNELIFVDTDHHTKSMKTLTRRTYDMYLNSDAKAIRFDALSSSKYKSSRSIGLLWHSKTNTLVTNGKTGRLQFYCPKRRVLVETLDGLKARILTLERDGRVLPSDITKAAFSCDGDWLAFYETRDSEDGLFPEVRLHIYQRSATLGHWSWIQTADRLHSTAGISDLKFSPDGQYLVSLGDDGSFHLLYKINLDPKTNTKQMYAKGFFGNVPENMGSQVAFSQDSSVLAIGLKNETTLIWMIVDPYKLEYECQLSSDDTEHLNNETENNDPNGAQQPSNVIGLHFGHYEPPRSIAPLCEVRSKYIRIWNILKAQSSSGQMLEYLISNAPSPDIDGDSSDEFTAATFDQSTGGNQVLDHFAVSTKRNLVYIFELKINQDSRTLSPLIVIDASLTQCGIQKPRYFTHMCFVGNSILVIDEQCHQDLLLLKLINRLCLMTDQQELVAFTDKLTLERESAVNNCNEIKTYELSEFNDYITKSASTYRDEIRNLSLNDKVDPQAMTEKQRMIKHKLDVQRMLKDLFLRVPSHNLPRMELLGPMILDKLVLD
jgi:WD40 repeat protein